MHARCVDIQSPDAVPRDNFQYFYHILDLPYIVLLKSGLVKTFATFLDETVNC